LAACTESPEGATAYVTLEPCCHTNKQTPPCVPRLIAAKIARVVVGSLDPNPQVNGNGVRQLREAGIIVDGPLLEAECRQLIAPFIARTVQRRSYLTMKWAQTADGKIAGPLGRRLQISNAAASHQVQLLRSRSDAIVVGISTVINDDPLLLPRGLPVLRSYRRIVLDRRLRLPTDSQLVRTVDQGPVFICTSAPAGSPRAVELQHAGIAVMPEDGWRTNAQMMHILIEAGPTLARALLPEIDRLWVIRSPLIVGDHTAPAAAEVPDYFVSTGELNLGGDVLFEYLNSRSELFFAAVPSADYVLATVYNG
jgi:diaminohydroxyphosphoribosylaminopyrimidine deaminase/5-amino-6-(5-phosphoribosylamino)uracil reductase